MENPTLPSTPTDNGIDMVLVYVYIQKFVVYSVDILFAMCTIKLQNMSCFNIKSPTLIVGDIKGKQQNC